MAMSGVELTDEAKITYEEIYKGKKHRYEFNKDEFAPEQIEADVNLVFPHGCRSDPG